MSIRPGTLLMYDQETLTFFLSNCRGTSLRQTEFHRGELFMVVGEVWTAIPDVWIVLSTNHGMFHASRQWLDGVLEKVR